MVRFIIRRSPFKVKKFVVIVFLVNPKDLFIVSSYVRGTLR